jgi:hypothetical protein
MSEHSVPPAKPPRPSGDVRPTCHGDGEQHCCCDSPCEYDFPPTALARAWDAGYFAALDDIHADRHTDNPHRPIPPGEDHE